MGEDVTLFTEVDRTGDPDFFIRFLDQCNSNPDMPIILDRLHLRPGFHVLDLGCGTGVDAVDIARHVAPSGAVTGIDMSETMIAEARRRTAAWVFLLPSRWATRPNSGSLRTRSMDAGRNEC
jgi:trans-aconitate methyltransferase